MRIDRENFSTIFNEDTFKNGLHDAFQVWKEQWVRTSGPTGYDVVRGPQKIPLIARHYLNEEMLQANKPEEEAYHALVEFAANQISLAHSTGQAQKAFEVMDSVMTKESTPQLPIEDKFDLMKDIFQETLDSLRRVEENGD